MAGGRRDERLRASGGVLRASNIGKCRVGGLGRLTAVLHWLAGNEVLVEAVYLWPEGDEGGENIRKPMNNQSNDDYEIPAEIDFSKGVRGLHHIPPDAQVLVPVSIERHVWEYFSNKAEERGVTVAELLTEVLRRDIEIGEALK